MLDKDQLLARSKERESALEDDLAALQGDVDLLEGQLEKAIATQKATEQAHAELKTAFDQAADHLCALSRSRRCGGKKEDTFMRDLSKHSTNAEQFRSERQTIVAEKEDCNASFKRKIKIWTVLTSVCSLLSRKSKPSSWLRQRAVRTNKARLAARGPNTSIFLSAFGAAACGSRSRDSSQGQGARSQSIAETDRRSLTEREGLSKQLADLNLKLNTLTFDLKSAKDEHAKTNEAKSALQRELDETRRLMEAKSSEDVKTKELPHEGARASDLARADGQHTEGAA